MPTIFRGLIGAALLLPLMFLSAHAGQDKGVTAGRNHYLMGCVGCHGGNGTTINRMVPNLQGEVGYFLNLPEGRDYLIRLPNIAFSTNSDQEVAELLNYLIFNMAGDSTPKGTKAFTAAEVTRLRKQPLTEINLTDYRNQLVERLIADYHAPVSMRDYGAAHYND